MSNEVKTNIGMGCFEHPEKTVVATCSKCGKFMCRECAEKYESKYCESCEKERISIEKATKEKQEAELKHKAKDIKELTKKELIGVIIKSSIGAILGFAMGINEGILSALAIAYMFAGIPWGWKFTQGFVSEASWWAVWFNNGWLMFFGVILKFALAILIGAVAMPIGIIKAIINFNKAKKLEQEINNK